MIFGSGIKLYNYLLIEIAIFIIVFAHTKGIFLDIIIMSKGNDKTQEMEKTMTYLYRGISEGKRVWAGYPNGKIVVTPKEKGYYDLVEFVDKNNNHIYKWEKSQYTKPEVLFGTTWYPFVDIYCN